MKSSPQLLFLAFNLFKKKMSPTSRERYAGHISPGNLYTWMLLAIFHIALVDLPSAVCKLPVDVGGPTYFLISSTSSRVREEEQDRRRRKPLPCSFFCQQALQHRYSLAGSRQDSFRVINKQTRSGRKGSIDRGGASLTDVLLPNSRAFVSRALASISFPRARARALPSRAHRFRVVFALGISERVLKYPALRALLNRASASERRATPPEVPPG